MQSAASWFVIGFDNVGLLIYALFIFTAGHKTCQQLLINVEAFRLN